MKIANYWLTRSRESLIDQVVVLARIQGKKVSSLTTDEIRAYIALLKS